MKVRCNTDNLEFIKKGETHEVVRETNDYYVIADGSRWFDYLKEYFDIVEEPQTELSELEPNNSKIIDDLNSNIKLTFQFGGENLIVMSKGKFVFKGQEIDDVNQVYEKMLEFLNMEGAKR